VTPVCGASLTRGGTRRQTPLPGVYFSHRRETSWGERRGRKAGGGKQESKGWRKRTTTKKPQFCSYCM